MYIYLYLILIAVIAGYFFLVLRDVEKRIENVMTAYNIKHIQTDYQMPGKKFTKDLEGLGAKELVTEQGNCVLLLRAGHDASRTYQFVAEKGFNPPAFRLNETFFDRVKSEENSFLETAIAVSMDQRTMNPRHVLLNLIHSQMPQVDSLVIPGVEGLNDSFSDALQTVSTTAGNQFAVHAPYIQYGLHLFQRAEDCETEITGKKIKEQLAPLDHNVLSMSPFDFTFLLASGDHFRELTDRFRAQRCELVTVDGKPVAAARTSRGKYRITLVDCQSKTAFTLFSTTKDNVTYPDHVTVFKHVVTTRAEMKNFPLKDRFATDAYLSFVTNRIRVETEMLLGEGDLKNYVPKLFSFAR